LSQLQLLQVFLHDEALVTAADLQALELLRQLWALQLKGRSALSVINAHLAAELVSMI
jgi:hypothetical protein